MKTRSPRYLQIILMLGLGLLCAGAATVSANVVDANKTVVRRIIESVWNEGQLDELDHLWSANVPLHFRGRSNPASPDSLKKQVQSWRNAFPDSRFVVEELIGEGDRVAIRIRITGTHTGTEWFGLPPTGKSIAVSQMMFFRLQDGKVVEAWEDYNELAMRRQLGATL